jgi:hypothetical protein
MPAIMFGSAGGSFVTNQYVDYRDLSTARDDKDFTRYGYPMNQLYANILTSMGMASSEFEPLNKVRSDAVGGAAPFKARSGYGVPSIGPGDSQMISGYQGWVGHDMSANLPLVRA